MNRFLFWTTLTGAGVLGAAVLIAPLIDNGSVRLVTLFAQDATLRHTAIASAVGLMVTAFLFFRSPSRSARRSSRQPSSKQPRPGTPMGA